VSGRSSLPPEPRSAGSPAPGTPAPALSPAAAATAALDLAVARLLGIGTLSSVAVLAVGVILMAVDGRSPLDHGFPGLDLARLPADLLAARPEGFLWLGLIAVILTPISRVTASLVGFARAADRLMVVVSAAILGVILLSIVISIALR
jgi:uncharacterized membrane protein